MTKQLSPLRRKDQATGYAKAVREIVAWLLSDGSRIDYEESGSAEFFGWWAADRIEALSAENKRLREQLSGISGRLNVMREALIHTAGICNPASGFLKNATGVRKKHIENVCGIALAALGDTK